MGKKAIKPFSRVVKTRLGSSKRAAGSNIVVTVERAAKGNVSCSIKGKNKKSKSCSQSGIESDSDSVEMDAGVGVTAGSCGAATEADQEVRGESDGCKMAAGSEELGSHVAMVVAENALTNQEMAAASEEYGSRVALEVAESALSDQEMAAACEVHGNRVAQDSEQSAAAAPSPVLGNMPPGDGMPVGPVPPGFFQGPPGSQLSLHAQHLPHNLSNSMIGPQNQPFMSPRYPGGPRPPLRIPNQGLGGVPGSQTLLPSGMDPSRQQGHPNMAGPMQRMSGPRGMVPLGPQSYGGGMRPPLNALGGPAMPGMNMGPGGGRPWPNPGNANSIPYSSASPGNYVGPPGGGGPPGTPIMPSPADSTNSGDNMYTLMNAVPPGGNRPNFPMGPGSDGPMSGLGGMEPHHINGSLGSGDMDSISKNSPNNMNLSNQPGTPRDDGEMGGNFLNPFQNESYSPSMTMSV
eukprot:XP_012812890.1 PREDICTED: single-stranded DNA-binding protein 2 isoform X3 [Xenopus tropicalis]